MIVMMTIKKEKVEQKALQKREKAKEIMIVTMIESHDKSLLKKVKRMIKTIKESSLMRIMTVNLTD